MLLTNIQTLFLCPNQIKTCCSLYSRSFLITVLVRLAPFLPSSWDPPFIKALLAYSNYVDLFYSICVLAQAPTSQYQHPQGQARQGCSSNKGRQKCWEHHKAKRAKDGNTFSPGNDGMGTGRKEDLRAIQSAPSKQKSICLLYSSAGECGPWHFQELQILPFYWSSMCNPMVKVHMWTKVTSSALVTR